MTVRFLTYQIFDTVKGKPAQKNWFNYGTISFTYTIFGVAGKFQGPQHWMNFPKGILFAESEQADDYIIQCKLGYSATVQRFAPPLDITADIQAGIYLGNLLKANIPLVKLLEG